MILMQLILKLSGKCTTNHHNDYDASCTCKLLSLTSFGCCCASLWNASNCCTSDTALRIPVCIDIAALDWQLLRVHLANAKWTKLSQFSERDSGRFFAFSLRGLSAQYCRRCYSYNCRQFNFAQLVGSLKLVPANELRLFLGGTWLQLAQLTCRTAIAQHTHTHTHGIRLCVHYDWYYRHCVCVCHTVCPTLTRPTTIINEDPLVALCNTSLPLMLIIELVSATFVVILLLCAASDQLDS